MSKSSKSKKSKVPKLTEAQYAEYIAALKTEESQLPKGVAYEIGGKGDVLPPQENG